MAAGRITINREPKTLKFGADLAPTARTTPNFGMGCGMGLARFVPTERLELSLTAT